MVIELEFAIYAITSLPSRYPIKNSIFEIQLINEFIISANHVNKQQKKRKEGDINPPLNNVLINPLTFPLPIY